MKQREGLPHGRSTALGAGVKTGSRVCVKKWYFGGVVHYLQCGQLHRVGTSVRRFGHLVVKAALIGCGADPFALTFEPIAYIAMAGQCIVQVLFGRAAQKRHCQQQYCNDRPYSAGCFQKCDFID